jgi:hypothetical protein
MARSCARFRARVARLLQIAASFAAILQDTRGLRKILSMVSAGRLLWLTPFEWSVLLVSAALCAGLTLLGA